MNSLIELLNSCGRVASNLAWPILWQSSLLIALALILDWKLGRKLRPGLRYVLWLVVMAKLVLPPSLALPTGLAWWVRPHIKAAQPVHLSPALVTYGPSVPRVESTPAPMPEIPKPVLSAAGGLLAASAAVSLGLFGFLLWRLRQIARQAALGRASEAPAWLMDLADAARRSLGVRRRVALRLLPKPVSPALFGLFRPVILLPEAMTNRLSPAQLRPVLLHELIHLRRFDVWMNCAQTLLQIIYWWHPLVWVANHHIRRVREEVVDEAVMLALRDEAASYAPTLLEVARLALPRPLASLGLIGILESHGALRQRIERLVDFRPPRRAGVGVISILCATAFAALALPMGPAQEPAAVQDDSTVPIPSSVSTNATVTAAASAEAKVLVQDGKLLFEMGKLDEAEEKLRLALKLNPRQQVAFYYLDLVMESRAEKRGILPKNLGRRYLLGKLEQIVLPSVEFDHSPLADVVKSLAEQARLDDLDGAGINILLAPEIARPQISPVTGLPEATQTDVTDIGSVTIRISPGLANVRLRDALDAIVKVADTPIKYSIEDNGVVFSLKSSEGPPLYTRWIKVDPNTFKRALSSALGRPESGTMQELQNYLRDFLAGINVDLSPPKSVFWKDRDGTLLIRATLSDLDTIETAVQALNAAPPQLTIRTRFLELSESEEAAFWNRRREARHPLSFVRMTELNSEEMQKQLDEWKSAGSVQVLAQPAVTTLSGRQAQVQVTELMNIVMAVNPATSNYTTQDVPLGPILNVLPTVSTDTFRIDLAITASINEFLGYADPNYTHTPSYKNGVPGQPFLPQPRFRFHELQATASVWDGHTLVLGGGLDEQGQPADKPGDNKKRLLVMVTPTVIDPAGNRTHTDEDVESARSKNGSVKTEGR